MTLREKIALHIKPDKRYVSNSALSTVKKLLLGQSLFYGDEKFFHFGSEVHRRILEPQEKQVHTFDETDQDRIEHMVEAAFRYPNLVEDHNRTIKEQIKFGKINGLMFKGIFDMLNQEEAFGSDLKTTSTRSEKEFIYSASKYDYFRQAWIYMELQKLKQFRFYALQKNPPYDVFVLDVADYPKEMAMAKAETLLLIDVIKKETDILKYKNMRNPDTTKTKGIALRLHPELYDAIAKKANNKYETVSEYVRGLIKKDLNK